MRYDRQIRLDEVGASGQEKLWKVSVLIVGLGCPASQYLRGARVGKIGFLNSIKVS